MEVEEILIEKLNKYFPGYSDSEKDIYADDYLEDIFDLSEDVSLDDIISFISKYEDLLVESALNDELLKDNLLTRDRVIYRNEVSRIDKEFLKSKFDLIRNKQFDKESFILMMDVIKMINIYGVDVDSDYFETVLKNRIYSTVKNNRIVTEKNFSQTSEEMKEKSDILANWCSKCGCSMVESVIALDCLRDRIKEFTISTRSEVLPYKEEFRALLDDCLLALSVRDNNYQPTSEEVDRINGMLSRYKKLNDFLISNDKKHKLVHFVQTGDVRYKLVGGEVIDTNFFDGREAKSNRRHNDEFVKGYCEMIKKKISEVTHFKFSFGNIIHRKLFNKYLEKFNDTINNRPLDRLPINISETGPNLLDYLRPSSGRLSCSFENMDNIKAHLDRTIGLVMEVSDDGIISSSVGYTSNKDYVDLRRDFASYLELIRGANVEKDVNEVCLDIEKCRVVGVILLNERYRDKAEKIAQNYQVSIQGSLDYKKVI